jgi:AcrR family transcriptional regulator
MLDCDWSSDVCSSDLVREFLKNIGETMLTLWSTPRERHFLRVLMAEMPRLKQAGIIDPQVQVMKIRARIAEVFAALSARGLIREADPLTTAMRFMGPMLFLRLAYLSDITSEPDLPSMRADLARHLDSFWETVKPVAATPKEKRR